jgi:peroxisomal 2,4-dienoyl-CoA reductase
MSASETELGWAVAAPTLSPSPWRDGLLKGRVLVISGGGTGIGFGICEQFGKLGCNIAMCGRRQNKLDEACAKLKAQGINAVGISNDVRNPEKCVEFVDKAAEIFGRVDFLVNNAAGNFSTPLENLSSNGFKTVMDIDLHGSFNMAKAAFPHLRKNGGGVIINISATLWYTAFPFQTHAAAAKAAIDVMTNNMGVEWGDYGIRAISIAPGPINNTVGGPSGRVFGGMVGKQGKMAHPKFQVPTGRYGEVEDIANAAIFACSPAGSYLSSTTIVVDGGHWHRASAQYHLAKDVIKKISNKEKQTHKGGVSKL